VAVSAKAGIDAIEWGGDVHVPPGGIAVAQEARRLTQEAGLEVSSYGSYYKVLEEDGAVEPFGPVLDTALELGTDTIRIWADFQGSEVCAPDRRAKFIGAVCSALDAAQEAGVRLAVEFHANTLTDSNHAAKALLEEVNHPNLYAYWQPIYWLADPAYRLQGLELLRDRILNLHVFQWAFSPFVGTWTENTDRRPLSEGAGEWQGYFQALDASRDHFALLEFIRNDDPGQFLADAAALKKIVAAATSSA
jgi:sugar phosphate isomerase/epimerase